MRRKETVVIICAGTAVMPGIAHAHVVTVSDVARARFPGMVDPEVTCGTAQIERRGRNMIYRDRGCHGDCESGGGEGTIPVSDVYLPGTDPDIATGRCPSHRAVIRIESTVREIPIK